MNKKCAKCEKTVYPLEELKCLDKIWHKVCFRCESCNMTLNMKNYKGYNKLPYCSAHYPQTKFTAVAETPESRRIAENTKIQSSVKYHADWEQQKGKKLSVDTDPETERIKKNTSNQSNVQYWGIREQREMMENRRPQENVDDVTRRGRNPGKIEHYNPASEDSTESPYSKRTSANVVYDSQRGGEGAPRSPTSPSYGSGSTRPGSNTSAPFSYGGGGPVSPTRTSQNIDPASPTRNSTGQRFSYVSSAAASAHTAMSNRSSAYGGDRRSSGSGYPEERNSAQIERNSAQIERNSASQRNSGIVDRSSGYGERNSGYVDQTPVQMPPPVQQPARVSQPPPPKQTSFVALYDYTAADDDEVSFMEGDVIVNTQRIDDGWMTGVVQRTGAAGMLPSNYVERCN